MKSKVNYVFLIIYDKKLVLMKMKCSVKLLYMFNFVIFLTQINLIKTDLPVHCLANSIEGKINTYKGYWKIHLGENDGDNSISCGHEKPDQNLDHIHTDINTIFKEKYSTIIKIERPNLVLNINTGEKIGTWTMVYDEGFEFKLHSYSFFAFSKYSPNKSLVPTNTDTEDTPGYKNECRKTFLGWFNDFHSNKKWGCFWAEQTDYKAFDVENLDYSRIFDTDYNKIVKRNSNNLRTSLTERNEGNTNDDFFNAIANLNNNVNLNTNNNGKINVNNNNNNSPDLDFSILGKNGPLSDIPEMGLINNTPIKTVTPNKVVEPRIKIRAPKISISIPTLKQKRETKSEKGNGPISSSNSYDDFFHRFISAENEIPHLDIYYLNKLAENKKPENFLELDLKTKYFEPDLNYVDKINNPVNEYPWKAKIYKDFIGKTYSEMRNLLGNSNSDKVFNINKSSFLSVSEVCFNLNIGIGY